MPITKLTTTLLAAALLLAAVPAAQAAAPPADDKPWQFGGSLTWRATDERGTGSDSDLRLNLTATKELLPALTFKATVSSYRERLFPTADYPAKDALLDQYSLRYAFPDGKSTLLAGRDDITYGNGLVVGDNLQNVTFATKAGSLAVQVGAFRNRYAPGSPGASAAASVQTTRGSLTLGATYVKQDDDRYKNWAVNASHPLGKITLAGEYTRNTAAADAGLAYCLTASYGSLEQKGGLRYTLGYVHAEANAVPPYTQLDYTNALDYKGPTLAIAYQLTAKSNLTLEYNRLRDLSDTDVTRTRLTYYLTF